MQAPQAPLPQAAVDPKTGIITRAWAQFFTWFGLTFSGETAGCQELWGTGAPNGVVTANVGSTYRRTDGGAGTTFYVKEVGADFNGWAAK